MNSSKRFLARVHWLATPVDLARQLRRRYRTRAECGQRQWQLISAQPHEVTCANCLAAMRRQGRAAP